MIIFTRFRVLNTRSKFILLHDYRLFTSDLHYIWKRFVNVLFVRQSDQSHRGDVSTGQWFELSTVPFPLPIKKVYVAKQLDFWRMGRYRKGATNLFPDKIGNLDAQELNAVVVRHAPAVAGHKGNDNEIIYSGLEIEVIWHI